MSKYHYVYRITNIVEKKYYYGVRSSKIEPHLDLGIKYFSSSTDKEFMLEQKENKDTFKYKIIRNFESRKEANNFEIYLHTKFNVGVNESFYNRAKATLAGFCVEGTKLSEEAKNNIRKSSTGRKHTEETKQKISKINKGRPSNRCGKNITPEHKNNIKEAKKNISEETRNKLSIANKGRKSPMKDLQHTNETKLKMKEKAIKREKLICPHCEKEGAKPQMIQWHFDNCKQK